MTTAVSVALMVACGTVILFLGLAHLLLTFRGNALHPRDPNLEALLQSTSPRLTNDTTMWKAWVGFNASHSMGAILFGALYIYFALEQPELLFRSAFLSALGGIFLAGYTVLGYRYWFSVPYRGIITALLMYVGAYVIRVAA